MTNKQHTYPPKSITFLCKAVEIIIEKKLPKYVFMNISYTNWIISLLCLKLVINDFPYSCYKHWNPYLDRRRLGSSSLHFPSRVISISDCLMQGSPAPGLQTGTGPRPVRNQAAQQEVSSGWVSRSFICIYNCFPWLALLPELCLLSDHLRHSILIGVRTLLWAVHVRDVGCVLLMRI